ncbi:MAG TPA: hypothetical protein VK785_06805, partial [Opitutaceae bacterium]|nr:hypothetical protein [Opitutaceae bacterium]
MKSILTTDEPSFARGFRRRLSYGGQDGGQTYNTNVPQYLDYSQGTPRFSKWFYTKIAKSRWSFCYQRQKPGMLGNLVRADTRLFVSFAT